MSSYTLSAREKILQSRLPGESIRELSVRSGVSTTSLYHWAKDQDPSFAPIKIHDRPTIIDTPIRITHGCFTIELPIHTDAGFIRSLLGC